MQISRILVVWLCLVFINSITCYCQNYNHNAIIDSIANKVEKITGHKYYISGTDVDQQIIEDHEMTLKDSYFKEKIKDPYHTLAGCFIFLASDAENRYPELPGFIGIYKIKTDSILWHSVSLSDIFSSGALGSVDATDELNRDGKVEIVIVQQKEPHPTGQLWIFNWDGKRGKLITQLDSYGESNIIYWGDEYELRDVDGDGIFEIQGEWYKNNNADRKTTVTYAWNGSLYGKWGKSSKRLLKGKKK